MRIHAALLSAAVTLALATAANAASPLADVVRIRPLDAQAAAVFAEAQQKSATVRELVSAIRGGDVVAYIQVVPSIEGNPDSGLRFVGGSKVMRFVLIQIAECKAPCREIERLGHELQHVTEVARSSWVTDDSQMQRMLMITGWKDSTAARGYETAAAGQVERMVRREVRGVTGAAE
jgi:hypothetical protein